MAKVVHKRALNGAACPTQATDAGLGANVTHDIEGIRIAGVVADRNLHFTNCLPVIRLVIVFLLQGRRVQMCVW